MYTLGISSKDIMSRLATDTIRSVGSKSQNERNQIKGSGSTIQKQKIKKKKKLKRTIHSKDREE